MTDWNEIVRGHGPSVWRVVRRLTGNDADAADAFQRAFLAAWEWSRKHAADPGAGLLRRMAAARGIECLRERYRKAGRRIALPGDMENPRTEWPGTRLERGELAEDLRRAIARLEGQQAEVFTLACLEEVGHAEIARELELSETNVGVLLHRAKLKLRGLLGVHDPRPKPPVMP